MATRWAEDFVNARGGREFHGDLDAMAGAVENILTNQSFDPDSYMRAIAKQGRGMTRAEADALDLRRQHGQAYDPRPLAGGGFADPGPRHMEDTVVNVRIPGEVYHGVQMPDVVQPVRISREYGFNR